VVVVKKLNDLQVLALQREMIAVMIGEVRNVMTGAQKNALIAELKNVVIDVRTNVLTEDLKSVMIE
jgi:hypothetical protein